MVNGVFGRNLNHVHNHVVLVVHNVNEDIVIIQHLCMEEKIVVVFMKDSLNAIIILFVKVCLFSYSKNSCFMIFYFFLNGENL